AEEAQSLSCAPPQEDNHTTPFLSASLCLLLSVSAPLRGNIHLHTIRTMHPNVTVVILAAGLGTRMKSRRAKVLHRAGGKSLVQHVVDTALELAPAERIFVVVGHQGAEVRNAVTTPGIGFIEQAEQKGTGHALIVGRE